MVGYVSVIDVRGRSRRQ